MEKNKKNMLIVGNWKMRGCVKELEDFSRDCALSQKNSLVMAMPAVYLSLAATLLKKKGYALSGQSCSDHKEGPWTGQVSAFMLADVGCTYVILGHTERREWEGPKQIALQIVQALASGLIPIVCIHNIQDWENIFSFLCEEEDPSLFLQDKEGLHPKKILYVAYEPAVGQNAPPENAPETLESLKHHLPYLAGRILYGGAVQDKTAPSLKAHCGGFLVGRASWHASHWNKLLQVLS